MICRTVTMHMKRILIGTLKGILTCKFKILDPKIFRHRFFKLSWTRNLSFSLIQFRSCLQQKKNLTLCLLPLTEKCQHSSVVAVKVIRFNMPLIEELLADDPDLRVIHLVRDPRGMLQSWREVSVPRLTDVNMQISANIACQRMLTDSVTRRILEKKFPGRIHVLRYEDLATHVDRVLDDVYIGLLQQPVPPEVRKKMNDQINAEVNDGKFKTRRKNGTASAHSWKRKIDKNYLSYVNKHCGDILSVLKYDES